MTAQARGCPLRLSLSPTPIRGRQQRRNSQGSQATVRFEARSRRCPQRARGPPTPRKRRDVQHHLPIRLPMHLTSLLVGHARAQGMERFGDGHGGRRRRRTRGQVSGVRRPLHLCGGAAQTRSSAWKIFSGRTRRGHASRAPDRPMRSLRTSVIDTYREKGVGEGGQVDAHRMMGAGMLVNAVRMRAPVHTLADQCG